MLKVFVVRSRAAPWLITRHQRHHLCSATKQAQKHVMTPWLLVGRSSKPAEPKNGASDLGDFQHLFGS